MPAFPFLVLDFCGGTISFGPGKTAILEAIDKYGTVKGAALATGHSYRQTWEVVKRMNRELRAPVVILRRGKSPAGASLTPLGKALVQQYRAMEREVRACVLPFLPKFDELLGYDPNGPMIITRECEVRPIPNSDTQP